MRSDMHKVIIERPRRGSSRRYDQRGLPSKRRDFSEDAPQRESTAPKRCYGYDRKDQTDLLGPLRRFLRKRVGRPWNDVFAEICAQAAKTSAVQSHLRDHVRFMVKRDGIVVNGQVTDETGLISLWPRQFYVDRDTGILQYQPPRPRRRSEKKADFVVVPGNNLKQLHKLKGVWYEVKLARYQTFEDLYEAKHAYRGNDVWEWCWVIRDVICQLLECNWRFENNRQIIYASLVDHLASRYGRKRVYAENLRRLAPKEIRRYKLA